MVTIIINEQHRLFPEQLEMIIEKFGDFSFQEIPEKGLSLQEIKKLAIALYKKDEPVLFLSPIPALMKLTDDLYVFHNDNRDKKVLPNGKIIFTPSEIGWEIV